jgi:hypothetical protein
MAAIGKGGHFDSALLGCSHFDWRGMARNTLPLSTRHLYPRIGPTLMNRVRLFRPIGALTLEPPVPMAVSPNTDTFTSSYSMLSYGRFRICQCLGLVHDFPIAPRTRELVGEQRAPTGCRVHSSLRVTPAMAAGVTDRPWDAGDLVSLLECEEKAERAA